MQYEAKERKEMQKFKALKRRHSSYDDRRPTRLAPTWMGEMKPTFEKQYSGSESSASSSSSSFYSHMPPHHPGPETMSPLDFASGYFKPRGGRGEYGRPRRVFEGQKRKRHAGYSSSSSSYDPADLEKAYDHWGEKQLGQDPHDFEMKRREPLPKHHGSSPQYPVIPVHHDRGVPPPKKDRGMHPSRHRGQYADKIPDDFILQKLDKFSKKDIPKYELDAEHDLDEIVEWIGEQIVPAEDEGDANLMGVGDTCWKIAIGKEKLDECKEHVTGANSSISNLLWSVLGTEEVDDNSLCYGSCPNGFEGDGPICWKTCPTGTFECGPLCQTPDQPCFG